MIGILVALKSILEIKAVAGALGALDAGMNIAGLLKFLKSKVKRNSIEYQIICVIDESLKEACKELGWEYDTLAVSQVLDPSQLLNRTVMTKDELGRLFAVLVGSDIEDKDLNVIIDCFDKSVAGKEELYRYLDLKWKRYTDDVTSPSTDFSTYYKLVEKRFTSKKRGNHKKLVGDYSDEEAYIDTYLNVDEKGVLALSYLEKWFCEENSETMLIYGEPGQGKSTLCDKVVVEYIRGNFLKDKVKNVITVSLNIGDNPRIINDKGIDLEVALSWDGGKKTFTFEDCRNALLFMDGFDEFIDEAKKAGITNIISFMNRIDAIAFNYDIHIVVLSRTIAVNDYLSEQAIKEKSFRIIPITKDQQDDWLKKHKEYDDYQKTFRSIRDGNKEMSDILGIPLMFRMIVNSRFDNVTTNVVELYDKLTNHLLEKRNICGIDDKEQVVFGLSELAYNIYCNDTDTVTVSVNQWDTRWIFAFYIRQIRKRVIGFFHRSFYQYFLARYIYTGILNSVTDDQAKTFIGAFAERELDDTVRQYLSQMINKDDRKTIFNNLRLVIEALVRTEAYLNLKPRYPAGKAEKTKLSRTINVYRNTLHICASFAYVIEKPFRGGIDIFIRTYPSKSITICSVENNKANLSGANLSKADLFCSNLSGANLSGADLGKANLFASHLSGANLSGADLIEANLSHADLSGADLSGAKMSGSKLSNADLSNANLSEVNLSRADLSIPNWWNGVNPLTADLSKANWSNGAKLSGANLSGANLSRSYLHDSNLHVANLSEATLDRADLSNADLHIANLRNADLRRANLSDANLRHADLSGANLSNAYLSRADLSSADLSNADLSNADLSNANLSDADLSGANLEGAKLSEAHLDGANLSGAILGFKHIKKAVIDSGKKELINPSIQGYETIRWIVSPEK